MLTLHLALLLDCISRGTEAFCQLLISLINNACLNTVVLLGVCVCDIKVREGLIGSLFSLYTKKMVRSD